MVALSGLGWPAQARVTHPRHAEYAKRALLAYMPCPGLSGTEYIESVVKRDYDGSWPAFFCANSCWTLATSGALPG